MLLFMNSIKSLKKRKIQMLAIIIMIMLSTGIYTLMNTSLDRLETSYYEYLDKQNVEYFSFDAVIDYSIDVTLEDIEYLKTNYLSNITNEEKLLLNKYQSCLNKCDEETYILIKSLFEKYDAYVYISNKKIDLITDKYGFYYEFEKSKIISDGKYITKAIIYNSDKKINKPYLIEGQLPLNDNEITVLPNFAKENNLKIGDMYKINDQEYKIVGFVYNSNYIYPLISFNVPIFDEKYNNIIFMNKNTFNKINGLKEDIFVAQFNKKQSYKNRTNLENIFNNESSILKMNMNTMIRTMRIDMIQTEIETTRNFVKNFLYLILGIALFIIILITKKRIDDEKVQIGVLKSLGYNSFKIAISYLVYPIICSIIGGFIGYLIGIIFNDFITNMYLSTFNIPLNGFKFNLKYLFNCIMIPLLFLSIFSYLVILFMLKKKPLSLLKEDNNLKVNLFTKIINKLTYFLPFKYKFKYALAVNSLGKLFIISLTSFIAGVLIIFTLIGMNLFNSIIDKSFEGMSFKYMVSYSNYQFDNDSNDDLILQTELNDEINITLTGINENNQYLKVLDKNKHDLTYLVKDNEVVINENIKEIMNVDIGDTLLLNDDLNLKIVGITNEYVDNTIYINRNFLSEKLGIPNAYNIRYSNQEKYNNLKNLNEDELSNISSIFNISDLENNLKNQMENENISIYIVIVFSAFMSLVIISVIANIIVEENKKVISLMKVIGYKNNEINNMVLNIYTPFVIISYFLSIPVIVNLLKLIVNNMDMAIPISLSFTNVLIGLGFLLIGYYIAISLSKKVLNKIPLSLVLKED